MDQKKPTVATFRKRKAAGEKIVMITAYDATGAAAALAAGIDILLVGDSMAMTALGYENTLPLGMDEAIYHTMAVRRGAHDAFIIFDMPFMSYQVSDEEALRNAGRAVKEGGADAVKLEGGAELNPLIAKLVGAGIPVMAHIGLLPQKVMTSGGYHLTGKTDDAVRRLLDDARSVEAAGAFSVVLECMPSHVGKEISAALAIPAIGIGSGPDCDGQVQVLNDVLGLFEAFTPKHSRRYAEVGKIIRQALSEYAGDVRGGKFPGPENCFK
ncbi:MAG: 3-methyl-2-oxobutanoate hydroxymethyltransferase [Victivallaceae bacterium]|nr:3-methyl-2-oxobutanoate hydroxymethyltransferase [Victivallaceae bacterium]